MKASPLVKGVGKPVSELVLGAAWFALKQKAVCFDVLDEFLACGGTAIDTARCYGESEAVIGEWMAARGNRDSILLITKGGLSKADSCRLEAEKFEEQVESDLSESLGLLRTDHVDLYFLHRDEPALPVDRVVDELNAQMDRGRIRAYGGSNWETRRADQANEYAAKRGLKGMAAVSNNLSLARPTGPYFRGLVSVDEAGERWHMKTGLPLFSWASQARGFFSGRFRPDVRDNRDMVRVYYTDGNFERLRRADELGKRKGGYSATQVALAWVMRVPFTVLPLVGPRSKKELVSCVRALEIKLSDSEVKWLDLRN